MENFIAGKIIIEQNVAVFLPEPSNLNSKLSFLVFNGKEFFGDKYQYILEHWTYINASSRAKSGFFIFLHVSRSCGILFVLSDTWSLPELSRLNG